MAIGLALILGFKFNINFNSPYKSTSITDFWRRWHISLSSWLRDYLYISLGGNRKGRVRRYINLIITMLLGGLWHGASLNFVLWGFLHGVALVLHKFWLAITRQNAKTRVKNPLLQVVCILITFHFVCFCWIFFRNADFASAKVMIEQIAFNFHPEVAVQWVVGYWQVVAMMVLGYVLHFVPQSVKTDLRRQMSRLPWWAFVAVIVGVVYVVIQFKSADVQPFIYFQF
jgi:D-alanyl-lipoteichoic acid acyltransferase DltB (MBOAT superfamily)